MEANRDKVEAMASALMEWETLDSGQIDDIMAGRSPRPPSDGPGHDTGAAPDEKGGDGARPRVEPNLDEPAGDQP